MTQMMRFELRILVAVLLVILPVFLSAQPEPATSKSQVSGWEQLKYGMFIHFNMNTYAGAEYDKGKMPAEGFNPQLLDVDQWIRTARDAGMKYAVLTAKHTGGFCLWDSKVTWKGREYDYDIASSPIKKDIVAQFMESCRKCRCLVRGNPIESQPDALVRNSSLDISRNNRFCGTALARSKGDWQLSDYHPKSLSGNKNSIGRPQISVGKVENPD